MRYLDANSGTCNPLRNKKNCQSVVVAFEARRRGLNCYAIRYSGNKESFTYQLGERFQDAFLSVKSGKPIEPTLIKEDTREETLEKLAKELKTPGRYVLGLNGIEGHVISIDVTKKNELIIHDEQNNSELLLQSLQDYDYFELVKIDKTLLNVNIVRNVLLLY